MTAKKLGEVSSSMQGQGSTEVSNEQLKSQLSMRHSSFMDEDPLFCTPQDLVCPITLSLFQDPVINAVGQVYERSAIQRHLLQAALTGSPPTDPISNAILPSVDLVPVYPMRSRAAQYRESVARECVRLAASPDCSNPVRYLRRAAELVVTSDSNSSGSQASATAAGVAAPSSCTSSASLSCSIPGMTLEFAKYLAAHQGAAYDALALKYFGNELLRSGCHDAAADVFYRLLLEADERVQQTEYLQLCLDCWTSSSSVASITSNPSPAGNEASSAAAGSGDAVAQDQQQQQQAPQQQQQCAAGALSPVIISKLADFVQRQRNLSPSAIVHMLQSTSHGTGMAMQLCQVLLARASATAAAAAGPGSEGEAAVGLPGGLGGALEVLVSYIQLGNEQTREQLQQLLNRLQVVEAEHTPAGTSGDTNELQGSSVSSNNDGKGVVDGQGGKGQSVYNSKRGQRRKQSAAWRGGKGLDVVLGRVARVAAAGTLTAANLLPGQHILLKVARVVPLMYLLRAGL